MSLENLNENVTKVLVNINANVQSHINDSDLVSAGILDSLDIMRLVMELERTFKIEIEPADVISANFESVAAISALIEKCKN